MYLCNITKAYSLFKSPTAEGTNDLKYLFGLPRVSVPPSWWQRVLRLCYDDLCPLSDPNLVNMAEIIQVSANNLSNRIYKMFNSFSGPC